MNISNYLIYTMQFTSKHTHASNYLNASNYLTCAMQFNVNIAQGKLTISCKTICQWEMC